jgi:large subunit ribosomal protein L6
MSRVGKQPITIPAGVDVKIKGSTVTAKGPKGELTRTLSSVVSLELKDNEINVSRHDDSREGRSHQGLVRSLVANMVNGVATGFTRDLEINGVGYRAEKKGNFIRFDLGYSHPIYFELPATVEANVQQTAIQLSSPDKEIVGQVAAKIRSLRKPEPYKGKGIKYKEERIIRKEGKSAG